MFFSLYTLVVAINPIIIILINIGVAYEAPESSSVESGVESGSVETAGHGSSRVTSHFLNISLFGMRILASAYIAVQHPKNDKIEVKSF